MHGSYTRSILYRNTCGPTLNMRCSLAGVCICSIGLDVSGFVCIVLLCVFMYCLIFRMLCFVYVICLVFVSFWFGYVGVSVFICVGVFSFNMFVHVL